MLHILERFFLHLVSSTFITLAIYFLLRYLLRTYISLSLWISPNTLHLITLSALLVFALLPLREPFDVYFGKQVWYKAIFDQASWLLGAILSAYGLYRFNA